VDIQLSELYPIVAPNVQFRTRVHHPCITEDGQVFLQLLCRESWSPQFTIKHVLETMHGLLRDPNIAMEAEETAGAELGRHIGLVLRGFYVDEAMAIECVTRPEEFARRARECTRAYAMDQLS
jgi:hypothetical protein